MLLKDKYYGMNKRNIVQPNNAFSSNDFMKNCFTPKLNKDNLSISLSNDFQKNKLKGSVNVSPTSFSKSKMFCPLANIEISKLVMMEKEINRQKSMSDCEFRDYGFIPPKPKPEKLKFIKHRKRELLLPALCNSLLKINSCHNVHESNCTNEMKETSFEINNSKQSAIHLKKTIIRRSPGRGVCIKINDYKKNCLPYSKSQVNIQNDKDLIAQLYNSIDAKIKEDDRRRLREEQEEEENYKTPFTDIKPMKQEEIQYHSIRDLSLSPHKLTEIKPLNRKQLHIDNSIQELYSAEKRRDKEMLHALHKANLDELRNIVSPSKLYY